MAGQGFKIRAVKQRRGLRQAFSFNEAIRGVYPDERIVRGAIRNFRIGQGSAGFGATKSYFVPQRSTSTEKAPMTMSPTFIIEYGCISELK